MSALPWYNTRKAAQVVAFFANLEGKDISVLKATKLVYLADRESMQKYGYPMLNDRFVSMPHGPVNSITYGHIAGTSEPADEWDEFLSARAGNTIGLSKSIEDDDLDELSDAELEGLHAVWAQFGGMTAWNLRNWTHENCPEWEDPDGGAETIPHKRVLKFLGHSNADELAGEIKIERRLESLFEACR